VNKYLLKDLVDRGLWNAEIRNQLIADKGSVQRLPISQDLKDLYKTVWEIKQRAILDMCADRGAFICQSQSTNVHMAEPTTAKLTSMHFYAWKKGLKTGMYYLRTRPKADAIQFTVDQVALAKATKSKAGAAAQSDENRSPNSHPTAAARATSEEDDEICLSCGA
jgi:ribonucleoside-diphosphate reductase alpha chain/ribonucleoside-diphosphate reductase subunit M1